MLILLNILAFTDFQRWYMLSKTLAEEAAWSFAKDKRMDSFNDSKISFKEGTFPILYLNGFGVTNIGFNGLRVCLVGRKEIARKGNR